MTRLRLKKKFRLPFGLIIIILIIYLLILLLPKLNNKEILSFLLNNSYNNKINYKTEIINFTKYVSGIDVNNPVGILNNYNIEIERKEISNVNENAESEKVRKVYIYNTHQTEKYSDGKTVKDVSYNLKEFLNNYNIDTDIEEGNIEEFLRVNNWSYDYSYLASKYLIEENINNNNYDLIIDLHRDAISHDVGYININGVDYAKVLFVVGKENINYEKNLALMTSLNDLINLKYPGLSRGIICKEGYGVNGIYNQDINEKIILLEVGGNENSSIEAINTLKLIAEIINEKIGE